jgi:hypothetical protein
MALIWALDVAAAHDWTVEAVTAWPGADEVMVHEVPGHFCAPRERASSAQESAIARARHAVAAAPVLESRLINAHPVEALRDHAASARLVVVGTHKDRLHMHPGRAPVGESLALLVNCPVVLVEDDGTEVEESATPRREGVDEQEGVTDERSDANGEHVVGRGLPRGDRRGLDGDRDLAHS